MSEIAINIDSTGIEEAQRLLQNVKGGAQPAIMQALNVTAAGIKTDGSREASKVFYVNRDTVRSRMQVSKATTNNLRIIVSRKGPRFFARRFPHDANTRPGVKGGSPVFLRTRRDGSGVSLDAEGKLSKAFVATLPNRGRGIYRRIGPHRDRLTHARGLSVPDMLGAPDVRSVVQEGASKRLRSEIDRQVKLILEKSEGGLT